MTALALREIEPCSVCGYGLARHEPVTGRPCAASGCPGYVSTKRLGHRRPGPRVKVREMGGEG